ncbi:hypothetical protein BaRGS_00025091 [Batillaria attramentaria]|uniref:Uncharacterized protein n=1 Tax=Batillaria attramentaria TaxID=370345 RepID=A0ABD0K995_9CAEN
MRKYAKAFSEAVAGMTHLCTVPRLFRTNGTLGFAEREYAAEAGETTEPQHLRMKGEKSRLLCWRHGLRGSLVCLSNFNPILPTAIKTNPCACQH